MLMFAIVVLLTILLSACSTEPEGRILTDDEIMRVYNQGYIQGSNNIINVVRQLDSLSPAEQVQVYKKQYAADSSYIRTSMRLYTGCPVLQ